MKSLNFHSLTLLFISLLSTSHFIHAADIDAGKNQATFCLGCHGSNGNSKNPQYPSLAGQRALYIEKQLTAFQSGYRDSPVMKGMASKLKQQDIKNISAYFASLTTQSAGGDPALAKKGQSKVAMCFGCHGSSAQGRGGFPKLAGQHPEYLKKQLLNFKNRSRKGGPMNNISASLSEQDINEITAYLGSL
ncbi:MAG: cytochrome c4 [Methylococcales bacterium]|nr:cytochrome c4 [Methylococcales bacterium]